MSQVSNNRKIDFSAVLMQNLVQRFTDNGVPGHNNVPITQSGMLCSHQESSGETTGRFLIMKGAIPTDFSAATVSVRAADILCEFNPTRWSTNGVNDFGQSQTSVNPMILTTLYVAATQSGQATWFWWCTQPKGNSPQQAYEPIANDQQIYNQIMGTVGVTGSGSDLEIPDTQLVQGQTYRIFNFRLALPSTWTY